MMSAIILPQNGVMLPDNNQVPLRLTKTGWVHMGYKAAYESEHLQYMMGQQVAHMQHGTMIDTYIRQRHYVPYQAEPMIPPCALMAFPQPSGTNYAPGPPVATCITIPQPVYGYPTQAPFQ